MSESSKFTVDPSTLQDLARGLLVAHGSLLDARSHGIDASTDTFGDSGLAQRVRDFVDAWNWQIGQLGDQLHEIHDRLIKAADNYQQVESNQLRAETGG